MIITRLNIWHLGLYEQNYPCPLHWVNNVYCQQKEAQNLEDVILLTIVGDKTEKRALSENINVTCNKSLD